MAKFSVIIRCKNEERWIGHVIQSVLDHLPGSEIIIIDDHSEDDTLKVVDLFRSFNDIKVTEITGRYSPGKSINQGIKAATRENILIISAHSVIKKLDTEKLIYNLETDGYFAVFGKQIPVFRGKKITPRYIWSNFGDKERKNPFCSSEERHFFHNAFAFYKSETLELFPFNERLAGKEDRYWAKNIIENNEGDILYSPLQICEHHWTPGGNTWKGIG